MDIASLKSIVQRTLVEQSKGEKVVEGEALGIWYVGEQTIDYRNLFRQANLLNPREISELLNDHSENQRRGRQVATLSSSPNFALPRLFPRIVGPSETSIQSSDDRVRVPFVGQLSVEIAVECGDFSLSLYEEDLRALNKTTDEVYGLALENFRQRTKQLVTRKSTGRWTRDVLSFKREDGYESSQILLPSVRGALMDRCGSEVLVGIPALDRLVACAADDKHLETYLRRYSRIAYARLPNPITERLLLVSERGLELV